MGLVLNFDLTQIFCLVLILGLALILRVTLILGFTLILGLNKILVIILVLVLNLALNLALNQKIIDEMDTLKKGFDRIFVDVKEVSESLMKIRAEILKINKNLDKTARKSEVKELESLLELYSPIKSKFVTMGQVERFVEEKIEEKH